MDDVINDGNEPISMQNKDEVPKPITPEVEPEDMKDPGDIIERIMGMGKPTKEQQIEEFNQFIESLPTEPKQSMKLQDGESVESPFYEAYKYEIDGNVIGVQASALSLNDPNLDTVIVLSTGRFIVAENNLETVADVHRNYLKDTFPHLDKGYVDTTVIEGQEMMKGVLGLPMELLVMEVWRGDKMLKRYTSDEIRGEGGWDDTVGFLMRNWRFARGVFMSQMTDFAQEAD